MWQSTYTCTWALKHPALRCKCPVIVLWGSVFARVPRDSAHIIPSAAGGRCWLPALFRDLEDSFSHVHGEHYCKAYKWQFIFVTRAYFIQKTLNHVPCHHLPVSHTREYLSGPWLTSYEEGFVLKLSIIRALVWTPSGSSWIAPYGNKFLRAFAV